MEWDAIGCTGIRSSGTRMSLLLFMRGIDANKTSYGTCTFLTSSRPERALLS